jgi:hypothetical protein
LLEKKQCNKDISRVFLIHGGARIIITEKNTEFRSDAQKRPDGRRTELPYPDLKAVQVNHENSFS